MIRQQFLTGTPVIQLLRIIRGNRIELKQWRNVTRLFLVATLASIYSILDHFRYGKAIEATEIVKPPIFVLGHWRSGTTLLQTLLSLDQNITTPTFYQCSFPQSFLSVNAKIKQKFRETIPVHRLFDAMPFGVDSPFDDEMATLKIAGDSMMLDFVFPNRIVKSKTPFRHSQKWPGAIEYFAKKLTFATGKQLVFKSPVHGYRVGEIIKVFPEARFIILTRNPEEVYLSSKHQVKKLLEHNALHESASDMENYITHRYQSMLASFKHALINLNPEQFTVITYEQLVSDTLGTLETLYKNIDIADWETAKTSITSWLETQAEYKPNSYAASEKIPSEWKVWATNYNPENLDIDSSLDTG